MSVESHVGKLLAAQGLTLVTAESCTGGLLAHRITNVPGSSAYFLGGVVSYADRLKEDYLGVRHQTLLGHGAVSEETAREMAWGARQRSGADVGLSVTGIAGPGGGTPDKPVGLVYIALSAADAELCERHEWHGDRLSNKEQSVEAVLSLLLTYLENRGADEDMGIEFINQVVAVEVQTGRDGKIRPLAFVWRGRRYQIQSWGREGTETGEGRTRHCFLVQTAGPETWELCQDMETAQWLLKRHWAAKYRAV